MALVHSITVPVPASVAAGAAVDLSSYGAATVYLFGTFTATVQFQISPDGGTTWFNEGAALTAPGVVDVTKKCTHVRANMTAFTSGTPAAKAVGVYSVG